VNDGYQPIVVSLDIKNRVRIGEIRSGQCGAYGMNVCEIRLLKYLPPACKYLCCIAVKRGNSSSVFFFMTFIDRKYSKLLCLRQAIVNAGEVVTASASILRL
jgi:hypothetical protein